MQGLEGVCGTKMDMGEGSSLCLDKGSWVGLDDSMMSFVAHQITRCSLNSELSSHSGLRHF